MAPCEPLVEVHPAADLLADAILAAALDGAILRGGEGGTHVLGVDLGAGLDLFFHLCLSLDEASSVRPESRSLKATRRAASSFSLSYIVIYYFVVFVLKERKDCMKRDPHRLPSNR